MTTLDHLPELIDAGFSGLWIRSFESEEVERAVLAQAAAHGWRVLSWDCSAGVVDVRTRQPAVATALTPQQAIKEAFRDATGGDPTLLLMTNLHRFVDNPQVAQAVQNQVLAGRKVKEFVVAVSPVVRLPAELEKLFTVVEHKLPDAAELAKIAGELGSGDAPADTVAAARGLTRLEAENAFTLSLVRHGAFRQKEVHDQKAQALEKSAALTLYRGADTFDSLVGLENLKRFCSRALRPDAAERARGVMLLGVSGTGKSQFVKALGTETGRPVLMFDVGACMSKYVGESEEGLRNALAIADAMAPAVLFVDEVEKAMAGGAAAQSGDSGVSKRLFGALLTWLNDHTSDVFVAMTANSADQLPPEFTRAERLDAAFFLDLPDEKARAALWAHYMRAHGVGGDYVAGLEADDAGWTGAEIKSCCRIAALLGVPLAEAAQYVVPVSVSAREKVDALRDWATDKCLSADVPGRYKKPPPHSLGGGGDPPARRTIKVKK